jgi:hypothetical protein
MDRTSGDFFPRRGLYIVPCTVSRARQLVEAWHRHLPDVQGGLFASALNLDDKIVGVALAANPPREWNGTGRIVIARVATLGTKDACSKLYGSMCRAAKALGYLEAWTYTLPEEPGTSLRAAGFEYMGVTDGGTYDSKSKKRNAPVNDGPKLRWRRRL